MSLEGWCTIESDPGVFTEMIQNMGVSGVEVDELYGLDDDDFGALGDAVFGLIFLFKWVPRMVPVAADRDGKQEQQQQPRQLISFDMVPDLFFANQVINNACATQALLSILLNLDTAHGTDVSIGEELTRLKQFTAGFDPQLKGLAISNSEKIRAVHNEFGPNQQLDAEKQEKSADAEEDIYHFVSYVPHRGAVYELDGLQEGPILLGSYVTDHESPASTSSQQKWWRVAVPAIQRRIYDYSANEIRFNLMAVVADREKKLLEERDALNRQVAQADSTSDEDRQAATARLVEIEHQLARERARHANYATENARRKHNYVPFMLEMLKLLASKGALHEMFERERMTRFGDEPE
ncbi:Ubiquitin carboxyl-terminal hydrolase 2 [Porphyridium purpureum]|uniref:Ubiquitin carboxyl-terminal hydrolase n=1 Tax=Porphyridium purpureum TaxID=35688 RepID=A0A5J4YYE7_PORPP|nr:Ubiquitin carboxyl-terminal hydrolase 2 [Porphyridium purpureum]|eukprot:POR0122..scf209_3